MKKNSFVEGTIISYIILLLTKVLGAVYVIPFYKIIGTEGGVLYGYAYNIYNLFLNISTSGIPTAVAIIISEYNALKMINEREYTYKLATKLISIISFCAFLVMFIFAKQLALFYIGGISDGANINNIILVIRVISLCLLVVPYLSVTRGYLQGNKYVSVSSFSQLLEQLGRIIIVLVGSYVAINLLNFKISIGVSVALSGTVIGALIAFIYLKLKIKKEKSLEEKLSTQKLKVTDRELINKIIKLAIPIIIIAITQNIYEMIDLKFIIKGLYMIGFDSNTCELLGSIVVTWAPKICMVINALAIGLCGSIIPFIVEDFVKGKNKEVNNRFNQAITTILFVSIPLAIFIITFRDSIYYLFYGKSIYGGNVLGMMSIVSITFSISLVINMILQGMKKHKVVYQNTFIGILVNTILDIPMILLLNRINFLPYIGSLVSTFIGQTVAITLVLYSLKKEYKFEYGSIFKTLKKMIFPLVSLIIILIILSIFNINSGNYIVRIIKLGICGLLSIGTYILVAYKNKSLSDILGEDFIDKILRKLKIKRN